MLLKVAFHFKVVYEFNTQGVFTPRKLKTLKSPGSAVENTKNGKKGRRKTSLFLDRKAIVKQSILYTAGMDSSFIQGWRHPSIYFLT